MAAWFRWMGSVCAFIALLTAIGSQRVMADGRQPKLFGGTGSSLVTIQCSASGKANYITGTNCQANGSSSLLILGDQLTINGTQVAARTFTTAQPDFPGLSVTFDSTYFADGTTVFIVYTVTDYTGASYSVHTQATVYNKAFVYGNQVTPDGEGSLHFGLAATNAVRGIISSASLPVSPGAMGTLFQDKPSVLTAIPNNTVFYTWTHGTSTWFGDSRYDPAQPNQGPNQISDTDVSTAMSPAGVSVVGYNFVFIDACNSAAAANLSTAFGTGGAGASGTDKALLGYNGVEDDADRNVDWSSRVWQYLVVGYTLQGVLNKLVMLNKYPHDSMGNIVPVVIYGDTAFKLQGVYGSSTDPDSSWFR